MHDPAPVLFAPVFLTITGLIGLSLYLFSRRVLRDASLLAESGALRGWLATLPALVWGAWAVNVVLEMGVDATSHGDWPLELVLAVALWLAGLIAVRLWLGALSMLFAARA